MIKGRDFFRQVMDSESEIGNFEIDIKDSFLEHIVDDQKTDAEECV